MRAQRVRVGESRVEMQFAKWTAEGAVAVVISIGSISAYKYITSPKEESIPLETTLEDAAELTTQKMIISDVFRSTKGTIPHCTIDEDSIKIKSSDLKIYDTNFAIMSVDKEVVMELVGEAEKKAKKKAESDEYGFLENADENAKKVIKGMFENLGDIHNGDTEDGKQNIYSNGN